MWDKARGPCGVHQVVAPKSWWSHQQETEHPATYQNRRVDKCPTWTSSNDWHNLQHGTFTTPEIHHQFTSRFQVPFSLIPPGLMGFRKICAPQQTDAKFLKIPNYLWSVGYLDSAKWSMQNMERMHVKSVWLETQGEQTFDIISNECSANATEISSLIQIRIRPEHRSDGFRLATWLCKAKTSCAWPARHCVSGVMTKSSCRRSCQPVRCTSQTGQITMPHNLHCQHEWRQYRIPLISVYSPRMIGEAEDEPPVLMLPVIPALLGRWGDPWFVEISSSWWFISDHFTKNTGVLMMVRVDWPSFSSNQRYSPHHLPKSHITRAMTSLPKSCII